MTKTYNFPKQLSDSFLRQPCNELFSTSAMEAALARGALVYAWDTSYTKRNTNVKSEINDGYPELEQDAQTDTSVLTFCGFLCGFRNYYDLKTGATCHEYEVLRRDTAGGVSTLHFEHIEPVPEEDCPQIAVNLGQYGVTVERLVGAFPTDGGLVFNTSEHKLYSPKRVTFIEDVKFGCESEA